MKKRGMFIVLDGSDGCGKGTQACLLGRYLLSISEDNDILITHEPTSRAAKIKGKLLENASAYSDACEMARLYVEGDRSPHTKRIISPNLNKGVHVIENRYTLSTCAYQQTQGVPIEELVSMHKGRGILVPDITILLDISDETFRKRMDGKKLDKFESNYEFQEKVREAYRRLANAAIRDEKQFGRVILIDGNRAPRKIAGEIGKIVYPIYWAWQRGKLPRLEKM